MGDEYARWLREEHGAAITNRTETRYVAVAAEMAGQIRASGFWQSFTNRLRDNNDEYELTTGYPLLLPVSLAPALHEKPYSSFLLKTYRKNVSENTSWPDAPNGGWLLPSNWYGRINDIVRALFVVKYLDGVQFLAEKIAAVCSDQGHGCIRHLEAREEGYYAAHVYVDCEVEIPLETWDTEVVKTSLEIQITTQLKENIRQMLHTYYEERRVGHATERSDWQWDYKSDAFLANYLGHVLRVVEGMVMEVRERQGKETQ